MGLNVIQYKSLNEIYCLNEKKNTFLIFHCMWFLITQKGFDKNKNVRKEFSIEWKTHKYQGRNETDNQRCLLMVTDGEVDLFL